MLTFITMFECKHHWHLCSVMLWCYYRGKKEGAIYVCIYWIRWSTEYQLSLYQFLCFFVSCFHCIFPILLRLLYYLPLLFSSSIYHIIYLFHFTYSVSLLSSFTGTTSRRCSLDHRGVAYWEQPSYARCIQNEYRYLQQSVGTKPQQWKINNSQQETEKEHFSTKLNCVQVFNFPTQLIDLRFVS